MRRWTIVALLASAVAIATAQWVVPGAIHSVLTILFLALALATLLSQRSALRSTIASLEAAHREQIESERRYRALFDACSDALFVHDRPDDEGAPAITEVNEAACMSLGYSRPELLAMSAEQVIAPEARRGTHLHWRALGDAGHLVFETVLLAKDGERLPVEMSARQIEIRGRTLYLAIARDIAFRKEQEEHLLGISHRDDLTGLFNRRGFFAKVDQARPRARRASAQTLLMYFDVDGLKSVNDRFGHAAGDVLVVAAANALRLTFRQEDILARIGGDEFVALALLSWDDRRLDQETIRARLEKAMADKRAELGDDYDFSLSYGAVVATWEELSRIDELLARADALMYEAKRSRRRARGDASKAGRV
jgi:diguanylate cyclase (GGDEF)-like protein/PAS domain S-box-containing protein